MKKLILATLLATVSFTTYAQKFVAVKTDIGKDVVITGNKFYYTPGNGVLEECKDVEAYTGKEDNTERPFYSIIATCKNEIVAITGATITSKAVADGVNIVVAYMEEHKQELLKEGN